MSGTSGLTQNWQNRLDGLATETPIAFTGGEDWDEQGVLKRSHPVAWRL